MKRRSFLGAAGTMLQAGRQQSPKSPISEFANRTLPKVARTTAGLEPYTGPWGAPQIAHLLRRTTFGASRPVLDTMSSQSMDQLVSMLLADLPVPDPPVNVNSLDTGVPLGQTWVNAPRVDPNNPTYDPNSSRISSLKAWWTGLMLNQQLSLRERMTLFWQNHFVSESSVVYDARYVFKQNALFRQYALGNFKDLTTLVTTDPAMLVYLNGNTNTNSNPNENYARELQELFTIGKGPEIAPGNYTYYTEDDVKAAARVLTGWRDSSTNINSAFFPSRHDPTDKQFSANYGSTVIAGQSGTAGANEVDDLIAMIFAQEETAKFICRKLYRWFVYYLIDDVTEANVIVPMADLLRSGNYETEPVVQALLSSAHFYDPINIGCMIKDPVHAVVLTLRQMGVGFPPASDEVNLYGMWNYVRQQAASMQMDLIDPPNVAGWPAWYQTPQFYELWINSDTLPRRNRFTDVQNGKGFKLSTYVLAIDPLAFAGLVSDPTDPNVIVAEFARYLFPIDLTAKQLSFLHDILIPGLPDYEWTNEWNAYKNDPTNQANVTAVSSKLQALVSFMMDMPEYQLM